METWTILGEFFDKEALVKTEALLSANEIFYQIKTPESHLHSGFGQGTSQPFVIEVHESQLEKAKELLRNIDGNNVTDEVSLSNYTTEELRDIVLNPDEWHQDFVQSASEELKIRGIEVSNQEVQDVKEEKIRKQQIGEEPSQTIYFFMWFFAIIGGFIGIIAGYYYWRGKARGIDGRRYFMYTQSYRTKGLYMFLTGLASAVVQSLLIYVTT